MSNPYDFSMIDRVAIWFWEWGAIIAIVGFWGGVAMAAVYGLGGTQHWAETIGGTVGVLWGMHQLKNAEEWLNEQRNNAYCRAHERKNRRRKP